MISFTSRKRFFASLVVSVGLLGLGLAVRSQAEAGSEEAGSEFDRLSEADRKTFSKRFQKEIWPLMVREGKDGCVGCHTPHHRSTLRLSGKADLDFRKMLKEGFFLLDDAGSVLHLVRTKNPRTKMPPGNRKPWTKKEIEVLRTFVVDLDKKQGK
ncbi:MAG: hypothetical protein ACFCD0_28315 [Gemmataceae bacterium]